MKRVRLYRLPEDYEKMSIGFYLRLGKDGRWHCFGQKSEMDPSRKQIMYGPIELPNLETEDYLYAGVPNLYPKKIPR
jgi:hypothetical protein